MLRKLQTYLKTVVQLGFKPVVLNALYQVGLASGYWRHLTPAFSADKEAPKITEIVLPEYPIYQVQEERLRSLLSPCKQDVIHQADEIVSGKYRCFGAELINLNLVPPTPIRHWTFHVHDDRAGNDFKDVWEPARFGWVFPLAQAYLLTGDERYPESFWKYFESFTRHNPANMGPNWVSAQEVAMRILALTFVFHIFFPSPHSTLQRKSALSASIAEHASRIPSTLLYARSQNNNHLVFEAVGLYTAGVMLPAHAQAAKWKELGWRWFNQAVMDQTTPDGVYIQHSMNYHRLYIQAALWMDLLLRNTETEFPASTREKLSAASRWLFLHLDPLTGQTPNLGNNDGSSLFSSASKIFSDYRPVVQAASIAFCGQPFLEPGPWDELSCWLGLPLLSTLSSVPPKFDNPSILKIGNSTSWAVLRSATFSNRPAHADQLTLDLWWRGINILCDPGTYRYTAPSPWGNSLAGTRVHNTLMVDDKDQMSRASRFLWLDWAQAKCLFRSDRTITAEHNGYSRLGILHRRTLSRLSDDHWHVKDEILPLKNNNAAHSFVLQWLLPDWLWSIRDLSFSLQNGPHRVMITTSFLPAAKVASCATQLVRAGEVLHGAGPASPILGWYSPTYSQKVPATSWSIKFSGSAPISILTDIKFDEIE